MKYDHYANINEVGAQQQQKYADKRAVFQGDEQRHWFAQQAEKLGIGHDIFQVGQSAPDIGADATVRTGRILFSLPNLNCYVVAISGGGALKPCYTNEVLASPEAMGPRSVGTYPPGTGVLVAMFGTGEKYGIIMGAIPQAMTDGNVKMDDFVIQGSNAGFKREGYYDQFIGLDDEGGVGDFSNHRPMDQTIFDWGMQTETGVGLHLDPFLAFMRVDELCGIWMHYQDQHLVLAGYSMDWLTSSHTEEYRNDDGELSYYRGEASYPHEALGTFTFGDTAHIINSDLDVHFDKPVGKLEPSQEDQIPFNRYEEHGGYLGQGRIRSMSIPPAQASGVWTLTTLDVAPGVFREQISLDGEYVLASAKGITFVKRNLIPIPKRIRLQTDETEDADSKTNDNYKFSGLHGSGVDHAVGDPTKEGEDTDLLAGASTLDALGYTFGWKNVHPFHYHGGDYSVPAEEDLPQGTNQVTPDFGTLASSMWMPEVEPEQQTVDPRYGETDYYALMSMFRMTDDGGLVIQGGNGEEIRFERGTVRISAPGGVFVEPGKSFVVLAGDDAIVRANKSVDISANQNDVRIKSEKNLHMLAGNSGVGGMLLESRSSGTDQNFPEEGGEAIESSGIVVKCPESIFGVMSGEIYLGTGAAGPSGQANNGPIVLDAARGNDTVRMNASSVVRYVRSSDMSAFMQGDEVQSINENTTSGTFIDGQLGVTGALRVGTFGLFKTSIQVSDGHIATQVGGDVGKLRNPGLIRAQIDDVATQLLEEKVNLQADYTTNVDQRYYQPQKIGDLEYQVSISFGMRTETDYGTRDFRLSQSHWQVMAEATNAGVAWEENAVRYQNSIDQMPWPGKTKWQDEETLLTLPTGSFNQWDIENGREKPRFDEDSTWTEPKLGPFVKKKPQEGYKVIIQ
jgi:hypothetical protein